jgi:hypothetical protein
MSRFKIPDQDDVMFASDEQKFSKTLRLVMDELAYRRGEQSTSWEAYSTSYY